MGAGARKIVRGSVVLSLAVGSLAWHVPSASADDECLNSSSDFDRDGTPDVAVGAPGGPGHGGAVRVWISNGNRPYTTALTGPAGFGSAVTALSSYVDGADSALCSQLVVGSPAEGSGGVVRVYAFDARAKRFVSRGTFAPGSRGVGTRNQAGARFGTALATEQHQAGVGRVRPDRLYVGAPGFDVDGVHDAGHVVSFVVDGFANASAHRTQTLDYTDEDGAGFSSVGGRLGSSLSVGGGLVVAGAPGQESGGVAGAGGVLIETYDSGPDDFGPQRLDQATPRVPGTPEKGDRFGAAVHLAPDTSGRTTLLVGAPGEDLGRTVDAGAVTLLRPSSTTGLPVGAVRVVDQDTPGLAGSSEAGDAFGSAVSSMVLGGGTSFLIGTPLEDVGRVRDAGMVQIVGQGASWTQSSRGVPGVAETGDRMGASLGGSVVTGAPGPLVGVPGEDGGTGAVIVGLPEEEVTSRYLKGSRAGERFGFVVGP